MHKCAFLVKKMSTDKNSLKLKEAKSKDFKKVSVGLVFDIQRFSINDGPGIRTLVFMKGCSLRCEWCSNPEGQSMRTQIMFYRNKCRGSARCMEVCPKDCIKPNPVYGLVIDDIKCDGCGDCADACYYDAIKLMGKWMTVDEVMEEIMKDNDFYINSGGGVTLSGGAPLMQYEFVRDLLKKCKDSGVNTNIETAGHVQWKCFEAVIPYLDLIFFDYKHADPLKHKKYIGKDNKLIRSNLLKLKDRFENLRVRIPYIPGFNDSEEDIHKIFSDIKSMNFKSVDVLPYHRAGMTKYRGLGREYMYDNIKSLKAKDLEYLIDVGEKYDIDVKIEGID